MLAVVSTVPSFAPAPRARQGAVQARRSATQMARPARGATKADLIVLAEEQQLPMGFWDPLNLAEADFWNQGNEATIGWLRHAEIKHGRVAMAAFVGYIFGANKVAFPWDIAGGPLAGTGPFADVSGGSISFSDIANAGSPMDQWDALPYAAKCQILGTIFILEWVGETPSSEPHYMRGGKPGYYPSLKEAEGIPHPVPFDLFNPFGLLPEQSESEKARGRNVEINNGRAAMLGIFGFISASKGLIVPGLDAIEGVGRYDGVYMGAFSASDTGAPFVDAMLASIPKLEQALGGFSQ
jgi:hypothetical protein